MELNKIKNQSSAFSANLTVLQRIDQSIKSIVGHATHVSVYVFTTEWERKDVEGALFIVERSNYPHHQIIIMNRQNMNNMTQAVSDKLKLDVNQYLMFQSEEPCEYGSQITVSTAHGIWFHSDEERDNISSILTKIVQECREKLKIEKSDSFEANYSPGIASNIIEAISSTEVKNKKPIVLSKGQLKETLEELIQDDLFIDMLHMKYLARAVRKESTL
mmetsp:Transcript_9992/g.15040  ORF Transcript_9992/g.15040 Transcript_9992/m.15040 type:complete len:218 (-) Transcript_9992:32-685(-)